MKSFQRLFWAFCFMLCAMFLSCKKDKPAPDPCKDVVCQNGGRCNNGSCNCLPGWLGDKCQTYYTALLQGKFKAQAFSCGQFPSPITELNLKVDTVNQNRLFFQNELYLLMEGSGSKNFTIPQQNMLALSIWGDGYFIDDNNMFVNLNIGLPTVGQVASCSGNFVKQK